MEVFILTVGQLQTNTYIVADMTNKTCIIIDPAAEGKRILEYCSREELSVKGILITHGHFDHIGSVNQLKTYFDVPVVAHEGEANMMADARKNLSLYFLQRAVESKADTFVEDGEELSFGDSLVFECIEVPGHTANSICYYQREMGLLFTGDTLMTGAVGRTDMYDGPQDELLTMIKRKLMILDNDVKVYPGHGHCTDIGTERRTNPYLLGHFGI